MAYVADLDPEVQEAAAARASRHVVWAEYGDDRGLMWLFEHVTGIATSVLVGGEMVTEADARALDDAGFPLDLSEIEDWA